MIDIRKFSEKADDLFEEKINVKYLTTRNHVLKNFQNQAISC